MVSCLNSEGVCWVGFQNNNVNDDNIDGSSDDASNSGSDDSMDGSSDDDNYDYGDN